MSYLKQYHGPSKASVITDTPDWNYAFRPLLRVISHGRDTVGAGALAETLRGLCYNGHLYQVRKKC